MRLRCAVLASNRRDVTRQRWGAVDGWRGCGMARSLTIRAGVQNCLSVTGSPLFVVIVLGRGCKTRCAYLTTVSVVRRNYQTKIVAMSGFRLLANASWQIRRC